MKIVHHNPDTLYKNPAFSQAVSVDGAAKMIFVGGQHGIMANGKLAGEDFATQSEQALRNVLEALKTAGASQEHVVKLTIYVLNGQDVNVGFAAAQNVWGPYPTAITVPIVAGFSIPGVLVEIEAIAAI